MTRPAVVLLAGVTLFLLSCEREQMALDDAKPQSIVFPEFRLPSTPEEKREAQSIVKLFEPHLAKDEIVTSFHFGRPGISYVGFVRNDFLRGGSATFKREDGRWVLAIKLYQGFPQLGDKQPNKAPTPTSVTPPAALEPRRP